MKVSVRRSLARQTATIVNGERIMGVSKNFLAVVSLTIFITGLLALHPLAPRSGERTVETVAGQFNESHHLH
ncbi:MAG: hypothetical protein AAF974_01730 [Cyanobacteria bacterium P01_E01_bin.34]